MIELKNIKEEFDSALGIITERVLSGGYAGLNIKLYKVRELMLEALNDSLNNALIESFAGKKTLTKKGNLND